MPFNQDPLRYVTVMKLGLIPMEGVTRSYVLKIYFKLHGRGRCKIDNNHHYGARYLSLPNLMGND